MVPGELDPELEKALPGLLSLAVDDKTRQACQRDLLAQGCRLIAADGEAFLFRLPSILRDDHEQYRMFVLGHLLEVRRLGFLSLEFSMIDFPPVLVVRRPEIESRFAILWRQTDEGIYLCGPWVNQTDEQQARMTCTFVDDNVRYFDL